MAKKTRQPIRESAVKRIVRTPMFKMRVEKDKTKYNRKKKYKSGKESEILVFLSSNLRRLACSLIK